MSDTGGPGPGGPTDPSLDPAHGAEPEGDRPSWLLPAGLGLAVGAVIVAVVLLVTTDDSTDTTDPTAVPSTAPPETTGPETSIEPDATTTAPETSPPPDTSPPDTGTPDTGVPDTTTPPETTTPAEPVPPADPGTVRIDGRSFPILRSCLTVPLAPNTGDLQVTSHLFEIDERPGIVERWFDEGGVSGGTYREGRTTFGTGDVFDLDAGFALEVTREGGDGLVVANPEQPPPDCGTDNVVQTFEASAPEFTYTHTVLDACLSENDGGRRWIGYASDLASFDVTSADGTAADLAFDSPVTFSGADPEASVVIDGPSTAFSAIIGDQNVEIVLDDSIVRGCTDVDLAESR